MRYVRKLKDMKKKHSTTDKKSKASSSSQPETLMINLEENLEVIKKTLGESSDIVIRDVLAGTDGNIHLAVIYTEGLADKTFIQDFIIKPLMLTIRETEISDKGSQHMSSMDILKNFALSNGDVKKIGDFDSLYLHVLSGDTVVLLEGYTKGFSIGSRGWEDRGVNEPSSQTVIRGPKDGFSETLRTNTALVRRKIKDPNLWIETKPIGKKTRTDVALVYLKGVADDKIVEEVRERLLRINIDGILESGYIEEFIQDETYSPFPTVFNTERPDTLAAGILEGRIAILVDGTPFALLVPAVFVQFFQSSEDYYQRFDVSFLIRILRYVSFFLALITPSAYIAVTTFHQEMLPTQLLISLAAQREGTPFPALIEALLMELTFEVLREAGVRMPRAVGSAISIVGALVLGQAAVEAGIVSSAMIIVVSLTAISSFVMPAINMAISVRMLRFPLMFLAATFGLFGMILGLITIILHLCSLRSFGVPYMSPMAPFKSSDQKDVIFRAPISRMFSRPTFLKPNDKIREKPPTPKPESN
ncbi:spore germination protein [Pseudalkalibacillus hwajinpoensis]|uniref:spore germination protein n=1 Tax=Guptibacillus hwajinpoensis TaxID=208199 RepID=UPI00325AEE81